jgi:hypothetical protein
VDNLGSERGVGRDVMAAHGEDDMEHLIAITMVLVAATAGLRMLPTRGAGRDDAPAVDVTARGDAGAPTVL